MSATGQAAFSASDVLVKRRPRTWPYLVAAALAVAIPTAAEAYLLASMAFLVEVLLLFFLPAMSYDDANSTVRGQRRVAKLRADRQGVWFGPSLVLKRKHIEACATEPLADGVCNVQLWGPAARHDMSVVVPDADRARLLIEALGLHADRHAARFLVESAPLRTPEMARLVRFGIFLGAAAIVAATILVTVGHEWVGFLLVPALFAYYGIVRRLRRKRTITLGADAVLVKRSIPLSEIRESFVGDGTDATLVLQNNESVLLRFDGRDAEGKRDAFVSRLGKALVGRDTLPVAAMLEPGARAPKAWLDDLRRLGGDGYRSGGVPTEDLWNVVEHLAAPPGARIGALAVLVPRLDAAGRVRLAELAEATVKPEVRAALEAAADEHATDEAVLGAFEK